MLIVANIVSVGIVQFILALASFGLTIAECVQLFRHRLSPLFFLISNLIKTAIWIALVVTSAVLKSEGQTEETVPYPGDDGMFTYTYKAYRYATTTVILTFVLLIIFVIPLAYAAFIFHKNKRNWGAYNGILRREPEAGVPLGMMRDSCSPDDMIRSDFYAPREDTGEPKAEFMELQSKEPYEGSTSYKE